jgi:hypothetical protein
MATAIEEQRKAPQLSERQMNAKTAREFLQMHARSITCMAGLGHIPAHPIGYGQRKSWLFYISGLDESLGAQECSDISWRCQGEGGRVAQT